MVWVARGPGVGSGVSRQSVGPSAVSKKANMPARNRRTRPNVRLTSEAASHRQFQTRAGDAGPVGRAVTGSNDTYRRRFGAFRLAAAGKAAAESEFQCLFLTPMGGFWNYRARRFLFAPILGWPRRGCVGGVAREKSVSVARSRLCARLSLWVCPRVPCVCVCVRVIVSLLPTSYVPLSASSPRLHSQPVVLNFMIRRQFDPSAGAESSE